MFCSDFFAQKLIRNPFLYEKDNLHQHAAYPGVLPRFTTFDLGLYGPALIHASQLNAAHQCASHLGRG
jgi:hypothetical protein